MVASIKNQYVGINAHLNSILQHHEGLWEEFHTDHISDIRAQLNRQLIGTGYIVSLEKGLQIRRIDASRYHPESDVLVWNTKLPNLPTHDLQTVNFSYKPLVGAAILEQAEVYEDYFKGVAIYKFEPNKNKIPVAWIELLSPSNKKGGRHYADYIVKRATLLKTQAFCFVEIDYLHESPPTVAELPDYTKNQPESMPYRVSIVDSRNGLDNMLAYSQEFAVEETIPIIQIPLHANDVLAFELDKAYDATYQRVLYGVSLETSVNYRELPPNFKKYQRTDQQKIIKRMLTVIDAAQNSIDLEGDTVPLPINENLDPAMFKNP